MIKREARKTLKALSEGFPIVAITGPRQSGKTTLARACFSGKDYVNLEDIDTLEIANSDPRGFLERHEKGAIIDEVQRSPKLFSYLQVLVDKRKKVGQFILTGSQQFNLTEKLSQSLAGRVGILQLLPFSLKEIVTAKKSVIKRPYEELLLTGCYPALYDRTRRLTSEMWYGNYVMTYLERDVRSLLKVKDLSRFTRFVRMCAARHGQLLNLSSLANDCGITHNTAASWISIMEASYIIYLLRPYYMNFGKRLIKSPKIYFYDSGLVCFLLGITEKDHLMVHPQKGSIFEGFVLSEYLKREYNSGRTSNLYFWRDNTGNEIDLFVDKGKKSDIIEIKSGRTVNREYLKRIEKMHKITGAKTASLIYGGNQSLSQGNIDILPWNDFLR